MICILSWLDYGLLIFFLGIYKIWPQKIEKLGEQNKHCFYSKTGKKVTLLSFYNIFGFNFLIFSSSFLSHISPVKCLLLAGDDDLIGGVGDDGIIGLWLVSECGRVGVV